MLNLKDFGAAGNLSQNDSPALAAAIAAAGGDLILVPPGQYRLDTPVSTTLPVNLLGAGNGCGPGPGVIDNYNCSQFLINFPTGGTAITVTREHPSTFRGLQFNVATAFRAQPTIGIWLTAPGTANAANSVIEGCGFSNVWTGVRLTRPMMNRVRDCYFDNWTTAGVYAETTPGIEGGPGWIENNYFFGVSDEATTQGPCVYTECGYVTVARNLLLGGTVGVRVHVKNNDAGSPRITENWIENQAHWGVLVSAEPPVHLDRCTMLEISGNEFSNLAYAANMTAHIGVISNEPNDWISTIAIKDNILRSVLNSPQKFIWLATGKNAQIAGNLMHSVPVSQPLGDGKPYGIQCTGGAGNLQLKGDISIYDNQFLGKFTKPLELAPARPDLTFYTRANLDRSDD